MAARDISEAMAITKAAPPAIVLVSGPTLEAIVDSCRQLRSSSTCSDAAILAAVADGDQGGAAVLAAGADDFFVESLGEGVLRSRFLVAQRTSASAAARRAAEGDRDQFFELSLDLLCIAGFDGHFQKVNRAWTTTLGWSASELCSAPWLDFVHPEDRESTIAAGGELMSGAPVTRFTNRYRTKDGRYRALKWQAAPSIHRASIYAVVHDVTDELAAKEALRDLAESLATTLHSIGDGVIATDVRGGVVRMNPAAQQLTGWTEGEAKGRPIEDVFKIVNNDTRLPLESPVVRSLREGRVVALESQALLLRRDGTTIPVADSCAPIRTGAREVSGAVLVFRDQTGEVSAATERAKFEQKLIFADRMASVGTLAAGVAHEINNPLTYVMANVENALEEIQAISGGSASGRMKDLEEVLTEARDGVSRIAKIVRGLKTFSRADEERRSVVDLVPVLELSINMAFNEIRHRARLVKDYGKLPLVNADDARLGQVFINLLVNAAQALPEGRTDENEIRIVTSTDDAGWAVVEVRDTGPGIAAAHLARIFDPFFTTKPVGVGTGLGLAICHNIVTDVGGRITVDSELGKGTVFRVVLPPSSSSTLSESASAQLPRAAAAPRATVLLVDDEPAVGLAVRRVLRSHDVTTVTSAKEALAHLAGGKEFDVILSDLMMPGMSGMDLHAVLAREHPKMASRVVFCTGGAFTPQASAFLDEVANERLEKPFNLKQLREMVQKFVK